MSYSSHYCRNTIQLIDFERVKELRTYHDAVGQLGEVLRNVFWQYLN
jgi:hypothetical protein